ncbi:hypothetical protein LCGC14_1628530 [marine sediment metagenome]|uniref:Uncharacterized protein n=1 Tax=marine sediment metagenome TaxID=412755 RepID=A0A0F9L337_9ZZZZ
MPLWGDRLNPDAARIEQETFEIEKHLHNREIWFGVAAAPNGEIHVADEDAPTPFTVDAGNNSFGTALQILGSADTPVQVGMNYFDPGQLFFETAEHNQQEYFIRIICGETAAAGITARAYSTHMLRSGTGTFPGTEVILRQPRCNAGDKLWAQVFAPGQNTSEITLHVGIHEYKR